MLASIMQRQVEVRTTVKIPSGATESNVVNKTGFMFGAFQLPSAFTGTGITIQGSMTKDGTFKSIPKFDDNASGGVHGVITCAANDIRYLWPEASAINFIKFVSNATETADREIILGMHS